MKLWTAAALAGITFGLFACSSDDSSVSSTSDESLVKTSTVLDKYNQVLTYTETQKGLCLLENKKVTWNSHAMTSTRAFRYELIGDTLFLFPRSIDEERTSSKGVAYVGTSKKVYGTWTNANCDVDYEDGDYKTTCYGAKNFAFKETMKISSSGIVRDIEENLDYNFGRSEFVRDVYQILAGTYEGTGIIENDLFISHDANLEEFRKEFELEPFNEKEASFRYNDQKFTLVVDTAFFGYPVKSADVRVFTEEDTCSFHLSEEQMTKSLCKGDNVLGFETEDYYDASGDVHQQAVAYRDENLDSFKKCLGKLVKKSEVVSSSSETEDINSSSSEGDSSASSADSAETNAESSESSTESSSSAVESSSSAEEDSAK